MVFNWFISLLNMMFFYTYTFRLLPQGLIQKFYASGNGKDWEFFLTIGIDYGHSENLLKVLRALIYLEKN